MGEIPKQKKPHHMAFPLDAPCACGSEWGRPGIRFNEEGSVEFVDMCAGCARTIGTTVASDAFVTPTEEKADG